MKIKKVCLLLLLILLATSSVFANNDFVLFSSNNFPDIEKKQEELLLKKPPFLYSWFENSGPEFEVDDMGLHDNPYGLSCTKEEAIDWYNEYNGLRSYDGSNDETKQKIEFKLDKNTFLIAKSRDRSTEKIKSEGISTCGKSFTKESPGGNSKDGGGDGNDGGGDEDKVNKKTLIKNSQRLNEIIKELNDEDRLYLTLYYNYKGEYDNEEGKYDLDIISELVERDVLEVLEFCGYRGRTCFESEESKRKMLNLINAINSSKNLKKVILCSVKVDKKLMYDCILHLRTGYDIKEFGGGFSLLLKAKK